jgi:hypothetical protein
MYLMKRALVLSLVVVLGLGIASFAQSLSGEWATTITIDPTALTVAAFLDFSTELTITYEVGGWAFTSYSALSDLGWIDQTFSAEGSLGAWTFGSVVDFDPTGAFESLDITTGIALGGMSFGVEFTLADKDVTLVLTGSGSTSLVDIDVEITFGGDDNDICDLDWAGVDISLGFPFCCADVSAVIGFNCDGFDTACFTVGGIAIPNLPWLTIGAEVCYGLVEKTVVLTPSFDFGDIACFDLDIDVDYVGGDMAPLDLTGFTITGISLTCDIGAVTFTGVTILEGADPYFEWYTISTNDDACCGPFGFDLGFYFLEGGVRLFDIALIDADMSLQVATQFLFTMGLEINVETGAFTQWTIGFVVTW